MFRGQSEHAIDDKGRISLPSRFRDALEGSGDMRLILVPSPFEKCLQLFRLKDWEAEEARLSAFSVLNKRVMLYRRLYVSAAVDLEVDKVGRVRVPPVLRDNVGLDKDALWAGMGNIAELWSTPLWRAHVDQSAAELDELHREMERLEQEQLKRGQELDGL